MKIKIEGLEQLSKMADGISKGTTDAIRISINTSIKWGRTRIREDIAATYSIKLARLYASDKKKGLNTVLANNGNLSGTITAGHQPVSLSGFNGTKDSSEVAGYNIAFASSLKTRKTRVMRSVIKRPIGIQVQIQKGRPAVIKSAFRVKKLNNIVAARGKYNATTFQFRHGTRGTTSGPDMPIGALSSVSVATMALTNKVMKKWEAPIQKKYEEELQRQLKRLL